MEDHRQNVEEILHKVMHNTDCEIEYMGCNEDENDRDIYHVAWHRWVMCIKFDFDYWTYNVEGFIDGDGDFDKISKIVDDMAEEFAW